MLMVFHKYCGKRFDEVASRNWIDNANVTCRRCVNCNHRYALKATSKHNKQSTNISNPPGEVEYATSISEDAGKRSVAGAALG